MTITRRAFAFLPALAAVPALAQDTLVEEFDADTAYWHVGVTNFYALDSQSDFTVPNNGQPAFPNPFEGTDGENADPPTTEVRAALGLVNLSLNELPSGRPPNLETEWLVLRDKQESGEHVSAIVRGGQNGKARLWQHRCFDEGYVARVPARQRLLLRLTVDILREKFNIAGNPTGQIRRQFILDNIKVLLARVELRQWNGMAPSGRGGEAGDQVFYAQEFSDTTLSEINELTVEISLPTASITASQGDVLDNAVVATFEADLQQSERLAATGGTIRRVRAELRLAVSDEEFVIDVLNRIDKGGETPEPPKQ